MPLHSIQLISTLLSVFGAAIVGGVVARKLKQPLLLGYIAAGVLFGTVFSRFLDTSFIQSIADVGVTLLLFTLGVEFSFHRLRTVLKTVAGAAIVQILLCTVIFLVLFQLMGLSFVAALIAGVAASFSSTAVVVRLLAEKGELETVPGEIMTGWLIVQDLAVVPVMLLIPAIAAIQLSPVAPSLIGAVTTVGGSFLVSFFVLALIVVLGRRGIPYILDFAAKSGSQELFLLIIVGVVACAAVASFALGLSAALGAFIAGLLVAQTSQNHAIFSEIRPLRDVFAVVFFTSLGLTMPLVAIIPLWQLVVGMLVSIILVKWFVVMGLSRFLGFHRKVAFLVAVGLTQMSEFGFIIAREGASKGLLSGEQAELLVALTFLTIFVSAPLLSQGQALYYNLNKRFGRFLPQFFHQNADIEPQAPELALQDHIIICGFGRVGKYIGRALAMAGIPFVVIDYNSASVRSIREKGYTVIFGDPADRDLLVHAQVDRARAIVIAIPDRHTQEMIIGNAQTLNKRIRIICRSHHEEDRARLKSLGVHTIIQPEFEAALSITSRILSDFGVPQEDISGKISRLKIEHGLG